MSDYATRFIGQTVTVTVNRPVGSRHPDFYTMYPVNYGYVEGIKAPNGDWLDAYVLNVSRPRKRITGVCIAVIHRLDKEDDKLVVIPKSTVNLTDREIMRAVFFQEKYFKPEMMR